MKFYHLIFLFIPIIILSSCRKEENNNEDVQPDYLMSVQKYGGDSLDYAKSIVKTADSNYLILGETKSYGNVHPDVYLVKINGDGKIIWQHSFGGGETEEAEDIIAHPDGNYYIFGSTKSKGAGGFDIMVMKITSSGKEVFMKAFGKSFYDKSFFGSITQDQHLLVGGYEIDENTEKMNFNVRKITTDGQELWSHVYESDSIDRAKGAVDTGDGWLVTGNRLLNENNHDIILQKLDYEGNMLWEKQYGGPGADETTDFIETDRGDYLICGYSGSFYENGNNDLYLLEVNHNGDSLTSSHFGNSDVADYEEGYAIIKASEGGYYISGRSRETILVAKADRNLKITGSITYNENFQSYTAIGYDLIETTEQTLRVVGGQPFAEDGDMISLEIAPNQIK
ncbi:MAG: hypothetical protein K9I68_01955 [Bacteroidales bacterium]|nr:hypothetical protein [Bacteroidales bacterium]MCF8336649.1 hypothetical protein [Bacteroidales bacterium]